MSTFSTYDSTVNSFYLAFYGRPADPAGLKFWSTQLAANNGDMGTIVNFFADSEEAQVRFGTDTVADRITEIYSQLFNRAPDAEGMAFWTNAIENGHASLADVAISIYNGAQGSDATLSQLRQQAADAFTAHVEASGSEYAGYASIEAARILVRAVTAEASVDDLAELVNAAVSFADTATKTPKVVDAIAVNTTLLALFDTARGVKEPVALAKALADTAKAAAGDPVTLESLLRGGGMDKVLKVMPAKATLVDVVDALAKGGLPAAVEVVYPTAPTTPTPVPAFGQALSFKEVSHGEFDLDIKDNITNKSVVDVTFGYTGSDLRAGQYFEYSVNGVDWIKTDIDTFADTNTVVLKGVHLFVPQIVIGGGGASPFPFAIPDIALPNATTTISLRAADPSGVTGKTFVQKIVYDGYVAKPLIALENDTAHGVLGSDHDLLTKDGTLNLSNVEPGAKVEYLVLVQLPAAGDNNGSAGNTNTGSIQIPVNAPWASTPTYADGVNTVWVRVTDLAGNQSMREFTFTLDTEAPATPAIKLHAASNGATVSSGRVDVSGLDTDPATAWEYSTDNGAHWVAGAQSDDSGNASFTLTGAGDKSVLVRQYDAAGNVSEPTKALEFTIADQASVEVSADQYGIEVKQTGQGTLVLVPQDSTLAPTPLLGTGPVVDGWFKVAAPEHPVTGVIGVLSSNDSVLLESKGNVYTLGSDVTDTIAGSRVYGFGGDDTITGTDGNDFLSGGDGSDTIDGGPGDDVIIGGAGGDVIIASGGNDRIVINDASESFLWFQEEDFTLMFDQVQIESSDTLVFDFKADVTKAYDQFLDLHPESFIEEIYLALNAAYTAAAGQEGGAAVLMTGENGISFLVLDNGDHQIDTQDIVVQIVGTNYGSIFVDPNGNIGFNPYVN